jgi:hypothetical protein
MTPSPLAVLCDDFMPADISRRSRHSARHLANSRFSCSMCEAVRSSTSVTVILIHLLLSLELLTLVSLPHERDACSMLGAGAQGAYGSARLSQPQGAFGAWAGLWEGGAVQAFSSGLSHAERR